MVAKDKACCRGGFFSPKVGTTALPCGAASAQHSTNICSLDAEVTRESKLKWLLGCLLQHYIDWSGKPLPRLSQSVNKKDAATHASHECGARASKNKKDCTHAPYTHCFCAGVGCSGCGVRTCPARSGFVQLTPQTANLFGRRHATALYSLPAGRVSAVPQ